MNERHWELEEWLSRAEIASVENYRDFHLFLPDSEESERKREREVEVTIIRDEP